jgi:hypothetical protein
MGEKIKLSRAMGWELRRLAGPHYPVDARSTTWTRELSRRGLIDRGLLDPHTMSVTAAGRQWLKDHDNG